MSEICKDMKCRMNMVKKKEILYRMKTDKETNSSITTQTFSQVAAECECRFHQFLCTDSMTLRTQLLQKTV
jgi:hypothetical protein